MREELRHFSRNRRPVRSESQADQPSGPESLHLHQPSAQQPGQGVLPRGLGLDYGKAVARPN